MRRGQQAQDDGQAKKSMPARLSIELAILAASVIILATVARPAIA